jgi:ketosteroid isomerase-like protein
MAVHATNIIEWPSDHSLALAPPATPHRRTAPTTPLTRSEDGMSQRDFDNCVEAYRQALDAFVTGDAGPVADLYSRHDDVTLANPLGPPRRGWIEVEWAIEAAAANFTAGSARFEEVTRYVTADLGYLVQIERYKVQLTGTDEMVPSSLRVTMILRREEGTWKVAHRHADPITTTQPISTIIDT